MLKTPLKFIRKLESDWSKSDIHNNYPFIDDMSDMVNAIFKAINKLNTNQDDNLSLVKHNTMVCVHALLSETLISTLSELRIVLNTLNRSLIENYIILSFVNTYGQECAKAFILNSAYVYYDVLLKYKDQLTKQEEAMFKDAKTVLNNISPDTIFSNQYKWVNSFINKSKKNNTGLRDIAVVIGLEKDYNMLSNFHHQTHSSSLFAQHMNSQEFKDYDMYTMKIVMAFNYGYKICELVFDESEILDVKTAYNSIMKKYRLLRESQEINR